MTADSPSRHRRLAVSILFLCIAGWRGWGLSSRGLLEHDEGHYLLAARTYREVLGWVASAGPFRADSEALAELRDRLHRQGGTLYPAGKPGYVVLLAVASSPVGLSSTSALWLSWFAGMVCVALVPWVLREWGCKSTLGQLVAMAGVGFSPLVGGLSREVGGVAWSLAFGMLGLWLLFLAGSRQARPQSRRRDSAAAYFGGISLGYGFTCHYNLFPFVLAVFAADWAREWARDSGLRGRGVSGALSQIPFRRWGWVIAGGATIFILFEASTLAASIRMRGVYTEVRDYAKELVGIVGTYQIPALQGEAVGEGVRGWGWLAWDSVGRVAWKEGAVACVLAVGSMLGAGWFVQRFRPLRVPFVFVAVLVGFWLLHPWKVERSWAAVVVGLSLLAGFFLGEARAMRWGKNGPGGVGKSSRLGCVFVGLLAAVNLLQLAAGPWKMLWAQCSPIPEVAQETLAYMIRAGGSIHGNSAARSFAPLWKWAVIEEGRRAGLKPALAYVDFSRFDRPDIVFLDPNTGRDLAFPARRVALAPAGCIVEVNSINPPWRVAAYDLRKVPGERSDPGANAPVPASRPWK